MKSRVAFMIGAAALVLPVGPLGAETLTEALVSTYRDNPTLNAARAQLRATDEGVPQALANDRPKANLFAGLNGGSISSNNSRIYSGTQYYQAGLSVTQPVWTGGKNEALKNSAEEAVLSGRALLQTAEQTALLQGVSAYVNVIQDQALIKVQQSNLAFLKEQVGANKDKVAVGQATATDVASATAQLAAAEAALLAAEATLKADVAVYAQTVGHQPKALADAPTTALKLPPTLDAALGIARKQHPSIIAAVHQVEVAEANVKVQLAALNPTVSLNGEVVRNAGHGTASGTGIYDEAEVTANINIPVYEGDASWSAVRQAKESRTQAQLQLDAARLQVDAGMITAFSSLDAARGALSSGNAQLGAAKLALDGVVAQQKVGQKTELDVLNEEIVLVQAQTAVVEARRNLVYYAYAVLAGEGRLTADVLGLPVKAYDPAAHYKSVRDVLIGEGHPED